MSDAALTPLEEFERDVGVALASGVSCIAIETSEWERVEGSLQRAIMEEARISRADPRLFLSVSQFRGLRLWYDGWVEDDERINNVRKMWEDNPVEAILFLRDRFTHPFVLYIDDVESPVDGHLWRDFSRIKRDRTPYAERKTLANVNFGVSTGALNRHEMMTFRLPLPTVDVLDKTLLKVIDRFNASSSAVSDREQLTRAALGLTVMEAEDAFAQAYVRDGRLNKDSIEMVHALKKEVLKNVGALEYIEPKITMDEVGGLDNLKRWLNVRRASYSPEARERGIPRPKGVLLTGPPGTGKSLTAKAIAKEWSMPLIRFDLGAVYGGIVGESESNIRQALAVVEAVSPCVLFIDEIEKGMAGAGGSGDLDSGVSQRVFGSILTWMNDKTADVFVVATSNKLANLPPELKRKGRFDEIFCLDLPGPDARASIFEIHLKNLERNADFGTFDLEELAKLTNDYTGAEIEECVKTALHEAFHDGNRPIRQQDLVNAVREITPQANSMKKEIDELVKEARAIGRMASDNRASSSNGGSTY